MMGDGWVDDEVLAGDAEESEKSQAGAEARPATSSDGQESFPRKDWPTRASARW